MILKTALKKKNHGTKKYLVSHSFWHFHDYITDFFLLILPPAQQGDQGHMLIHSKEVRQFLFYAEKPCLEFANLF